ncbi:MAG: glycosyltransferase family 4 protein [Terrimesophilobacter sp.]
MNIAIVCDYFLDYVGGAQTSMHQQRRALEAAGHRVTMVSAAREKGSLTRPDRHDILVQPSFVLPGVELPIIANTPALRTALAEHFTAMAVDVVHAQTDFGLAHSATDVARELGLPVVHTVHTFYWSTDLVWLAPLAALTHRLLRRYLGAPIPREPLGERAFERVLRNVTLSMALRADAVVSPSAHQSDDLKAAGVRGPIFVIPNPMGLQGTPSVPLTDEMLAAPTLLWAARCEPVKRPLEFAEAAIAALGRTTSGFSVDFVGEGADLAALRKLVAGHPELRVHGVRDHATVLRLMDESAIVALSSFNFDNQPMTIAEAVSRGRGVLYCDPKLREGLSHAGFLARSPEISGLSEAIVELVDNPSEFRRLAAGAVTDAEVFSPAAFVKRVEAVYRGLLN